MKRHTSPAWIMFIRVMILLVVLLVAVREAVSLWCFFVTHGSYVAGRCVNLDSLPRYW